MSDKRGIWVVFSHRLALDLRSRPEVTKTIEEIKKETGTKMTIDSLRGRGYWNALREGRKDFTAHTDAGLALQEHLDDRGKVFAVTYRLAGSGARACADQA